MSYSVGINNETQDQKKRKISSHKNTARERHALFLVSSSEEFPAFVAAVVAQRKRALVHLLRGGGTHFFVCVSWVLVEIIFYLGFLFGCCVVDFFVFGVLNENTNTGKHPKNFSFLKP